MKIKHIMVSMVALMFVSGLMEAKGEKGHKKITVKLTKKSLALRDAMRELWAQHVIWTREFIVAAIANAPETELVAGRLFRNQDDIGNAMVPYYGKDAGRQLAKLLKEHIQIAADIVAAAKAQKDIKDLAASWHRNADAIAKFLSDANPHWAFKDMQKMLYGHLRLTTDEVVAHLSGDARKDIAAFDEIFMQAMAMADCFTDGITKQFPKKF